MRKATARYATDLGKAKAAGYRIITMMMPDMGIHYMNPNITKFDIRKPPILSLDPPTKAPSLPAFK